VRGNWKGGGIIAGSGVEITLVAVVGVLVVGVETMLLLVTEG